jgi:hypothetical protein
MPFNGSGQFTRVENWQADAAAGIKIRADLHDNEDDNLASGLSSVICRDGQSQITQDIPWNAKKITNLANPVNAQDAATKAYADSIRNFNSGIRLTGGSTGTSPNFVSTAFVGFTEADMSLVGRKADPAATPPTVNRLAFNSQADGQGTDLWTLDENGKLTLASAPYIASTPASAYPMGTIIERFYSASATWTHPAGLVRLGVKLLAGGGAGGWHVTTGANQAAGGTGGGAGGYAETIFDASALPASVAFTVGVGGAATASSAAAGSPTTFSTLSASGGAGGVGGGPTAGFNGSYGGLGGSGSGGTLNGTGMRGGMLMLNCGPTAGAACVAGFGGSASPFGAGALGVFSTGAGTGGGTAVGFGSGGGGAAAGANQASARAGGNGTGGFIMVTEYY